MEAGEKHGPHLRRYERREVANGRMKIISFFEENGEKVTKEAFGVDRKLIYISLKRIRQAGNRPSGLVPDSTAPKTTRRMVVIIIAILSFLYTY